MSILAAAIPTLLKAVPGMLGLFAGDKNENVVQDVLDIGKKVLNLDSDNAVLEAINNDPEQARLFQEAVMKDKHRLEEIYVTDKVNAREMYKSTEHEQADKLADRIMKWNFPYACLMFAIQCIVTWFVKDDATLVALTNSLCTLIISSLITQCKEVTGFYFGSSLGSKLKNKGG